MVCQYYSNYEEDEIRECFCTEHDHENNRRALSDLIDAIYNIEDEEELNLEYLDDQIRALADDYCVSVPKHMPKIFSLQSFRKIFNRTYEIALDSNLICSHQ